MTTQDDEEERLRAVALQNAQSILVARQRAEEALRKQSEWLRVTLASIGDAVISTNAEGRVVFMNGVAESLTGWPQAEALGRPLPDVFHIINEQSRQPVENPALRALREETIVGLANHTLLIAKDGAERPIDDSAAPIRDEQGHIAGCVLIFRDISERRRAERAVRTSEVRYRRLFESAKDGILVLDTYTAKIIDVNPFMCDLLGYSHAELVGKELWQIGLFGDIEASKAVVRKLQREHYVRYDDLPLQTKAGRQIEVEFISNVYREDQVSVIQCNIRDTTDRKRMQESERRLIAVVESSDDAIISKSLDSIIQSWNAAAERLFGYTAEQAVGRHISFLFPADRADEEDRIIARLRAGERVEHFDTVRLRSDGQPVHVSLTISPIKDAAGRVVGASKIARDITGRKRMEEELRKYAADLSEADRRKNEFLAMLAHELRNPLAPIRNAVQVLRLTGGNGERVLAASEMLERQVGQMIRLVDDLFDVSRVSRGKVELRRGRVELASVVNQAVEAARSLVVCMEHDLTVTLPSQPIYLNADPTRLAQVVGNLLNNACKFTDKGGCIWLTVEREGEQAVIRVRDTGIGIAADQLPRIFDMFTQVDTSLERAQSGLGIGLTLVKNLVEMHDGAVEVHSPGVGRGSEFVVRLPVAVETSKPEPPAEPLGEEKSPVHRRILVVDDNRDSSDSLAMLLKVTGHEVRTAYDGLRAVDAAAEFRPDVVLLDIGLPKLNGYEAAQRIKAQPWGKSMVLVALTGWGQEEDRQKSKDAGFNSHMIKPVDHAALRKLLAEMRPT